MAYDLLIKNGTVIDGTGKPSFAADIGVKDGVIKEISSLGNQEARKVIDATGKLITPGFIDITNHSDGNWSLFQDPLQEASLTQGVTTIVVGNCGVSLAPLASPEAIKASGKWQDISSVNVNWTSVSEYLEELSRHPLGVNVATLVGHNTLRRGVLGDTIRTLDAAEIKTMRALIEQSIAHGAWGFSVNLSASHEQIASTEEIIAIISVLAKTGGVCKIHLRNESRGLLAAVNEAITISRESRVPIIISHLKAIGRASWQFFPTAIKMIEQAQNAGIAAHMDITPYARTGSFLYMLLPRWTRVGGFQEMFRRFRDPEERKKIMRHLSPETLHFENIVIASAKNPAINGKTVQEIAASSQRSPEETFLDIILESNGQATVFGKTLSFRNVSLGVRALHAAIASNGAGVSREFTAAGKLAHPRSFGAFTHFLHRFVRDTGAISWEEALKKITSLPAGMIGIPDRGKIEKGYYADLVIFDPNTIMDAATYQNPHVPSWGIELVTVNGKIAVENGIVNPDGAGRILRKV